MYHFDRWQGLIESAQSERALESVLEDYAASILPSDIAPLPPVVHRVIATPDSDIAGHAVDLVRAVLDYSGDPDAEVVLREMAQTFVAASHRLGQLKYWHAKP